MHFGIEYLGWAATAVFVGSYFCPRPSLLRGVQMLGALLWIGYGVQVRSSPVIVANVLVFSAAAWTAWAAFRKTNQVLKATRTGAPCDSPSA